MPKDTNKKNPIDQSQWAEEWASIDWKVTYTSGSKKKKKKKK